MDITIDIDRKNVKVMNNVPGVLTVQIDLEKLWDTIVHKYTNIYIQLFLEIPITGIQDETNNMGKTVQTEVTQAIKVSDITDKKVVIEVSYPGEFDEMREPKGKTTVMGYNVKFNG